MFRVRPPPSPDAHDVLVLFVKMTPVGVGQCAACADWKEEKEGLSGGNSRSEGLLAPSERRVGFRGRSFQISSEMWVTPTHSRHSSACPTRPLASNSLDL